MIQSEPIRGAARGGGTSLAERLSAERLDSERQGRLEKLRKRIGKKRMLRKLTIAYIGVLQERFPYPPLTAHVAGVSALNLGQVRDPEAAQRFQRRHTTLEDALEAALATVANPQQRQTLLPERDAQHLTYYGFQRSILHALYGERIPGYRAVRELGEHDDKVYTIMRSHIPEYAGLRPEFLERNTIWLHANQIHAELDCGNLLQLIGGLYCRMVHNRFGNPEKPTQHDPRLPSQVLRHRADVIAKLLQTGDSFLRSHPRRTAAGTLRYIMEEWLDRKTLERAVPSNPESHHMTYRGFAYTVCETLYRQFDNYHHIAQLLGTHPMNVYELLSRGGLHDIENRYASYPKKFLTLREYTDAYAAYAADGYSDAYAAKLLSAHMRNVRERRTQGKKVLEKRDFAKWVRTVLPEPEAVIEKRLTSRQAREQYIVTVCDLLGNNFALAAEMLGTKGHTLKPWYCRIVARQESVENP